MFDRLSSLLLLLGHRLVTGLLPLLALAVSPDIGPLPDVGVYLAALTIWAIPDLVLLGRHLQGDPGGAGTFRAVKATVRAGYIVIAAGLCVALLLRIPFPDVELWMAIGGAYVLSLFVEDALLRRQLRKLAVLSQ